MFNLIEQLKSYKPFDKLEKENVKKVLNFLQTNTNCYNRSNLKGHITAGGFVCDKNSNILLNHHKITNMWFQFGGHSDGNENSLEVAKREVFEECGISNLELGSNLIFDVDCQLIDFNAKKNEPEHYHYDINFLFFVEKHDFKISKESKDIKWVSIAEAKKLINPLDFGMLRMVEKYKAKLKLCE